MTYTDFQPYLLPDTDAWALSEVKAIELLNYLENRGIQQVVCTPPIKKENSANTIKFLRGRFTRLQEAYSGDIKLNLSARYRLDEGFRPLLQEGELLPLGNQGKELLVDVSPLKEPNDLWEMLEETVKAGHTPVVMQPERTIYWGTEDFIRLREMGCGLMLNPYSLFGYHGDEALNYSRMLLKKEWYTYLCSGMEDTKVMRYSESFAIDNDLRPKYEEIEKNSRLLWPAMENG